MPSSISDLINTFVQFGQYKLQKQQLADQERKQQLDAVNLFMTMARQTAEPTELGALVQGFTNAGYGNPDQWTQLLTHVTPSTETLQAGQTQRGIRVTEGTPSGKGAQADNLARQTANQTLTGRDAGQLATGDFIASALGAAGAPSQTLADATAARLGAGMTPGDLVLDHVKAMMGLPKQQQAVDIATGLAPNAAQTMQNKTTLRGQDLQHSEALQSLQHAWATLNESKVHNRASEAVQFKGLDLEAIRNDNELKAALTRAGASGADAGHIVNLIQAKAQLIRNLTDKNAKQEPATIIGAIGALNSINQQLDAAGIANEGQIPYNPDAMVDPGFFEKFFGKTPVINISPRIPGRAVVPDTTRKP